jgi:hypothetical protein
MNSLSRIGGIGILAPTTTTTTQGPGQPLTQGQSAITMVMQATQNEMIMKKLDRIILTLESQNRMIALLLDPAQRKQLQGLK